MRLSYLLSSLIIILLNVNNCHGRLKTQNKKKYVTRKTYPNTPKTSRPVMPGQLFYNGKRLSIPFNDTEEMIVYMTNYTMFPDALHFPRSSNIENAEDFLGPCMNTTVEHEINKERLSELRKGEEVYMRVATHVIEYLCLEQYSNIGEMSTASLCVVATAFIIPFILKVLC